MTRPLRVGVIGANPNRSWAKDSHIPALRSLENVRLAVQYIKYFSFDGIPGSPNKNDHFYFSLWTGVKF